MFVRIGSLDLSRRVTFFEGLLLNVGLHLANCILEVLFVSKESVDVLLLIGSSDVHKSDISSKRTYTILKVN